MIGASVARLVASRILIIDDDADTAQRLERILLSDGYGEVYTVTDSRDAIARFDEVHPDLIFLDLHMPYFDGHVVLEMLRRRQGTDEYLPIVVLSDDATHDARERALDDGAQDFLAKPLDRTDVLVRTRNMLELRRLNRLLRDEDRSIEAQLLHQAFHDPLTGLANRALFRDRATHALARATRGACVSLVLLDLDNFKPVNDALGHGEGDRLLEAIAERLLKATRGCDTVARIGGDEFAVLLEGMDADSGALVVVQRIMDAMRVPLRLRDREVTVTASIGIAHAQGDERVDELLRNADVAMYRAKEQGKGGYAVFEPTMYAALLERLELEAGLRQGVERGEFRLVYQPIIELRTGTITGLEALLRWEHPVGDGPGPAIFIGVAEQTGLIVPIGRWVLIEACRRGREWQLASADRVPPTISVNVSGRQLEDANFLDDVASALADTQFPAGCLILEITETVLMANANASVDRLMELKRLGVRLAIDDFGTGYCNLGYLQRFPVDMLKIDKSFVMNMMSAGGDAALAGSIVGLARNLRLHTVAEGVESAEQREELIALGCGYGQGYLFARPVGPETITELLRAQRVLVDDYLGDRVDTSSAAD